MKNLLAISWAMPPMLFPRSVQVARLMRQICALGWQVKLVCCEPQMAGNDVTLDHELYAQPTDGLELITVAPDEQGGQPDPLGLRWLQAATRAAERLCRQNDFTAMVTFAQPWVDLLVGLEIKKSHKLPWAAHFSDPWVDSPFYASVPAKTLKAWAKLEKEVIRRADLVIFTNPLAQDLVMSKHKKRWQAKAANLHHCFDRDLLPPSLQDNTDRKAPLRLVYTGDFYGERTPLGMLEALARLGKTRRIEDDLLVEFWGNSAPEHQQAAQELGLSQVVRFKPRVSYLESLSAAANADVLLVIDAPSDTPGPFLPSKLVDYFMLEKPILAITPPQGASARALSSLGCPVANPRDIEAIARALETILDSSGRTMEICGQGYAQAIAEYDKTRVAERFQKLLNAITGGAR